MTQEPEKKDIIVRKALLSDIKLVKETTTAINFAYRSEGTISINEYLMITPHTNKIYNNHKH
jgi:hypothetical protein